MGVRFGGPVGNFTGPQSLTATIAGPVSGTSDPGWSASIDVHPTATNTTTWQAADFQIKDDNTTPFALGGGLVALNAYALSNGPFTIPSVKAGVFTVQSAFNGNFGSIGTAVAVDAAITAGIGNNGGGIATAYGVRATLASNSNTNPMITGYGVYVPSFTNPYNNTTTFAALQIDNQASTLATNVYAIRTGTGQNLLGDKTAITGVLTLNGGQNWHRTTFSNTSPTAVTADQILAQTGTLTAPQTVTLPAADTAGSGHILTVLDESGTCSGINTLTVTRAGADTINGATTDVLNAAYAKRTYVSDGTSKWTILA
jgi:hypothetical protein